MGGRQLPSHIATALPSPTSPKRATATTESYENALHSPRGFVLLFSKLIKPSICFSFPFLSQPPNLVVTTLFVFVSTGVLAFVNIFHSDSCLRQLLPWRARSRRHLYLQPQRPTAGAHALSGSLCRTALRTNSPTSTSNRVSHRQTVQSSEVVQPPSATHST